MKKAAILILTVLLLVGCSEKTPLETIEGTWDIHDKAATPGTMTYDTEKSISFLRYAGKEKAMPFTVISQDKDSITLLIQVEIHTKIKVHIKITGKDMLRAQTEGKEETILNRVTTAKQ